MNFHLSLKSGNSKTGPIPVSTSSGQTCPDACPLKDRECYARLGPIGLHWRKVSSGERGSDWNSFLAQIKALPLGQPWRHNQAGDLPGQGNRIDSKMLRQLTEANQGKRGFTYTHKPPTKANREAIAEANREGFTVNLSADNLPEADALAKLGIGPVVVILKEAKPAVTPEGRRVVVCPAVTSEVNCLDCMLCQKQRSIIVGFPAHGIQRKSLIAKL